MKTINLIFNYLDVIFDFVLNIYVLMAKIFLVAMVLIICVHVFFRYVLNESITWSEEISLVLMVIFGFISIAIGVQRDLHLSISMFYKRFPQPVQLFADKLCCILLIGVGVIMVVDGIPLIQNTIHGTLPATKLSAATPYFIIPLTGVLITYYALGDFIGHHSRMAVKEDWTK